jgi:predicted  nucleic acid-binding Zn-ribbon protein
MISWRAFSTSRDCADKDAQIKKLQDTIYEMAEENVKMEKKMLKYAALSRKNIFGPSGFEYLKQEVAHLGAVNMRLRDRLDKSNKKRELLQEEVEKLRKAFLVTGDFILENIEKNELSVRICNALNYNSMHTYADLLEVTASEFLRTPNIARKSLQDLRGHIKSKFPAHYSAFALMVDQ